MNNDEYHSTIISKEYLTISIEPDIHLSDNEQIHLPDILFLELSLSADERDSSTTVCFVML